MIMCYKGNTVGFIGDTMCWMYVKAAQSCLTLWDTIDYSPWNSPAQNTGIGSLSLLQGIFPTQGSNPGLLHCRQILYQLSSRGRPGILEWVVYLFSSRSSQPRNRTGVSYIVGRFFTKWAIRDVHIMRFYKHLIVHNIINICYHHILVSINSSYSMWRMDLPE